MQEEQEIVCNTSFDDPLPYSDLLMVGFADHTISMSDTVHDVLLMRREKQPRPTAHPCKAT